MNKKLTLCAFVLGCCAQLQGCDNSPSVPVAAKAQFSASKENSQSLAAMKAAGTCSLENVVTTADNSTNHGSKNNYAVRKGKAYKLIGFSTNVEKGAVPKSIVMLLVGAESYAINATTGLERPDVATYFKVPALASAGYQIDAGFDVVNPGEYADFVLDEKERIACPTHQTITVG